MKSTINAIIFLLLFSQIALAQHINESELKQYVGKAINELSAFIALPNDALNPDDIEDNIFWINKQFSERGFNTTVLPTDNLPLFFAATPFNDAKPTLLVYMHFDGQSVDPSKWDQENPFTLVVKKPVEGGYTPVSLETLENDFSYDWRLFGRSTADDKGPIIMLLNALDLLKAHQKELSFNLKIVLDSEEEKGSKPLPKAVKEYGELLEADFLVIADGPMHASGLPTLIYGCRGITTMSLTTHGPYAPQHSGHYGNYAPNPGFQMAQLLASMKDTQGRVTIAGYYDGISIDENTQDVLKNVPDDDSVIAEKLQFKTADKVGAYYQESLQYPSLNIRGLGSGWIGKEARTIVPATATAELDLRLVPETDGNRLKKLVKEHIKQQGYTIVDHIPTKSERLAHDKIITIKEGPVMDAFRTDFTNEYGQLLMNTLQQTFQKDIVQIRIMGGTVPIAPFINELNIPAFVLPMVNQDNNQHSPNENLIIGQLAYGIETFYALLTATK